MLDELLHEFPPLFHRWLLARFPEPAAWLTARLAYSRTAAVWSMVGHVVGLGDRHGENILLDCCNGDVVHVDFSCLFDKGLTLAKPEMVPFRWAARAAAGGARAAAGLHQRMVMGLAGGVCTPLAGCADSEWPISRGSCALAPCAARRRGRPQQPARPVL